MKFTCYAILLSSIVLAPAAAAGPVDDMLDRYREQGAGPFDPAAGGALWTRDFDGKSCASCHGEDVRKTGKHVRTGKPIDPLAPSVNAARLTDPGEMAKWLLRNCKWTLGRECSPQEKGDVLSWLARQ